MLPGWDRKPAAGTGVPAWCALPPETCALRSERCRRAGGLCWEPGGAGGDSTLEERGAMLGTRVLIGGGGGVPGFAVTEWLHGLNSGVAGRDGPGQQGGLILLRGGAEGWGTCGGQVMSRSTVRERAWRELGDVRTPRSQLVSWLNCGGGRWCWEAPRAWALPSGERGRPGRRVVLRERQEMLRAGMIRIPRLTPDAPGP